MRPRGHLEKRCPTRFDEDFVNPGNEFPYGEWLKAGENVAAALLPLQPILSSSNVARTTHSRGLQAFGLGTRDTAAVGTGKENNQLQIPGAQFVVGASDSMGSTSVQPGMKRKAISIPKKRAKKIAEVEICHEIDGRPSKKNQIGASGDLVVIPVVAATQPHQSS